MLVTFRSAVFSVGYLLLTIIYGLLSLLRFMLPKLIAHRIIITWCRLVIGWLRLVCGVDYHVVGHDNLSSSKYPVVILSKHQSTWETLYLQSLFFPASTVLKKELLKVPFFGWGLQGLQPIAIDRSNPRNALKQVKTEGVKHLGQGLNVLLFPEGTRVKPGEKGKYARSGADIAIAANVDVVPVAVNAGHCWPPHQWRKYPGLVTVVVGKPIAVAGKTSRDLTDEVEQWIEAEIAKLE